MSNQESRDGQQAKQTEDQELLRGERHVRAKSRDAHLEAGREQARNDNALARATGASPAAPGEDAPGHMSDEEYEAKLKTRKDADRAAMKAEARSRYEGSDEDFERDWPGIREQLVTETLEKDLKQMRGGL